MTAEPKRIVLRFDADQRFAIGVGGAVRCLAEASGMPEEVCREFQAATVNACMESFKSNGAAPHQVELSRFDDRIEVVVNANSSSSAIRLARPVSSHS